VGGNRNVSILEAIELGKQIAGMLLTFSLSDTARIGDHRWWISDMAPFQREYPEWRVTVGVEAILRQLYEHNADRWLATRTKR
jgi:CDP-paratose 2-epimerase